MTKKRKPALIAAVLLTILIPVSFFFLQLGREPREDVARSTFERLDKVRERKKHQVVEYYARIRELADGVNRDKLMLEYFRKVISFDSRLSGELEFELDRYYVSKYGYFYDILFVDSDGYVFHSIKKESDYRTNLFDGSLAGTKLGRMIRQGEKNGFVPYEDYPPSDEPAAFFVIPVGEELEEGGWIILQCSLNSVNDILTDRKKMGRTGEVYLINQQKMMLTDSRFIEDSTMLRLMVDTQAARRALNESKGRGIIEDYRGIRVFSSFERFDVFGTSWIIIAEIDEDEVITEYYKKHRTYFQKGIVRYLSQLPHSTYPAMSSGVRSGIKRERIDMDEFGKSAPATLLFTRGISTCTGIAIVHPEKPGYIVHVSPTDAIYITNPFAGILLRERRSNFLDELTRRIMYYSLSQSEFRQLQFIIAAPHHESFARAVDMLLEKGIELSNIRFFYNPKADSVNMLLDGDRNTVEVQWNFKGNSYRESAEDLIDLGSIVKKLIDYHG